MKFKNSFSAFEWISLFPGMSLSSLLHHMGFLCNSIEEIKSRFNTNTNVVTLGTYELTVNSFGGQISTLFMSANNLITEYVELKNE